MTAVYRLPGRARLGFALALLLAGGCRRDVDPGIGAGGPRLQPGRFELAAFLASAPTAVDSPTAVGLLAKRGIHWTANPTPPPARFPVAVPPGFRIAAASADGDRVAFVREIDPDSTEVLLHVRSRLDTRLLLPIDRDARFLPQRFSADGSRLWLFTDEGDDTLQLELLDPDTGRRERRARPGCDALRLDASPDGTVYAMQWSCAGAVEAALFEAASGVELGPLPLPLDTRLARALPAGGTGGALYEVASAHLPRDLIYSDRLDPDSEARPLSFGLAPTITAADLVEPSRLDLRSAAGTPLPAELWWPGRPTLPPPGLVWLESDQRPPNWLEFEPFLQFLANRGVAVLRLRLRGSDGFGLRFRHAADGRLVDAGLEDLDTARAELVRRGADPARIALVGEGPWSGALAAVALVERNGRFAAAADFGGAADPLLALDVLPELDEPARSWWIARLGDPASEGARRQRARMLLPTPLPARQLWIAALPDDSNSARETFAALWEFLAAGLATPL